MSRSFKKSPASTNSGTPGRRFFKREANCKVRNTPDIPDGMAFKRVYCPYNICDYNRGVYYTPESYRRYVENLWSDFEKGVWWLRDRGRVMSLARRPRGK